MNRIIKKGAIVTTISYFLVIYIIYQLVDIPLVIGSFVRHRSIALIIGLAIATALLSALSIWFTYHIYKSVMARSQRASRGSVSWAGIIWAVAIGFTAICLSSRFFEMIIKTTRNQQEIQNMINPNTILTVGIMVVIISPIVEELLIRGLLINLLFKDDLFWVPIIVSSLIFAGLHAVASLAQFGVYFVMGLILGWAYLKTNTLLTSIGLHMLNNGMAYLSLFVSVGNWPNTIMIPLQAVVIAILAFVAYRQKDLLQPHVVNKISVSQFRA